MSAHAILIFMSNMLLFYFSRNCSNVYKRHQIWVSKMGDEGSYHGLNNYIDDKALWIDWYCSWKHLPYSQQGLNERNSFVSYTLPGSGGLAPKPSKMESTVYHNRQRIPTKLQYSVDQFERETNKCCGGLYQYLIHGSYILPLWTMFIRVYHIYTFCQI